MQRLSASTCLYIGKILMLFKYLIFILCSFAALGLQVKTSLSDDRKRIALTLFEHIVYENYKAQPIWPLSERPFKVGDGLIPDIKDTNIHWIMRAWRCEVPGKLSTQESNIHPAYLPNVGLKLNTEWQLKLGNQIFSGKTNIPDNKYIISIKNVRTKTADLLDMSKRAGQILENCSQHVNGSAVSILTSILTGDLFIALRNKDGSHTVLIDEKKINFAATRRPIVRKR